MLTARNVTVSLGRNRILEGLDFDAHRGEITVIIGPNGSGKTTLLRAMTGELSSQGEVALNGRNVADLKPWELAAMRAVLPQNTDLAFPFTVNEVVGMGLNAGAFADRPDVVLAALSAVGLLPFRDRHVPDLSGGERQRVHLARVLAQVWEPVGPFGPRWLLLDEPTSALDIAHQLQVMQASQRYAKAGGGVIAVMHDLNLSAMYADRLVLMKQGRVLAAGPTAEVMTERNLSSAYGCQISVERSPSDGKCFVLPQLCALDE